MPCRRQQPYSWLVSRGKTMDKVSHIKHRARHTKGDPTSRLLTKCSAIFCPKPHHEFFHNDRPHGEGHQVPQQFWNTGSGSLQFDFLPQLMDIIQLMPDLDHALHPGAHEAVDRSEPTMNGSTPRHQLWYVGPSRSTMSSSDCVIGKVHGFAKAQAFPLTLVELRDPCRLRREHVRLCHQPRALLDDLLSKGTFAFQFLGLPRYGILPMPLTALDSFAVFHRELGHR